MKAQFRTSPESGQTHMIIEIPEILKAALATSHERVAADIAHLEATNLALTAKADLFNRLLNANGLRTITVAADFLSVKKMDLFHFLEINNWISRRDGSRVIVASPAMVQSGFLAQQVFGYPCGHGGEEPYGSVLVTSKGLGRLAVVLGLVPQVQE